MKRLILVMTLLGVMFSSGVYSQTPTYIVGPGEYQCFFIKSADKSLWGMGGGSPTLGIGSNTGIMGTPIKVALPAGTQVKAISSGLHSGIAVDVNGNVWFWGINDVGQLGNGVVDDVTYYSPMQITTDSLGNAFNNVAQTCDFWNETAAEGVLACKNDGTVWIWGNTIGGMRGNGQAGQENPKPVQINIPGNPHIVKVLAGEICMALDNAGNVYTWGGNGRNTLLGTNASDYSNVHQVTLPKPAKDIAGAGMFEYALSTDGTLYGWGLYGSYLGIGTGTYLASNTWVNTPVDLTSDLALPHPVSSIITNSVCTHVILTDSTLWGWGDNSQGGVGNGQQLNYATYNPVYEWDWGPGELLQHKPVQIAPLVHNFTNLFAGTAACFYTYAESATGQLYAWGRNKAMVQGNGVVGATPDIQATYPDGWEQPTITAVNPFALTHVVNSTCPYCLLNPGTYPCSEYAIPADVPPVSNAGANQNLTLPTSTTILDGSGSTDPDGYVIYYKWREVSGPSANTVLDSTYQATRISGLVAGTYVFSLTVTDNGWATNTSTVTVVVGTSVGNVAPTVSAGSSQTITLPVSSVTLTGTATGNGGATISSTDWTQVSGPGTAVFGAASSLSTGVSGLVAGTYVFKLTATDNNSLTATATVTITVDAAVTPPVNVPPTVSAGSPQTITLPTSSVTLTGTATGNGGATISSTDWTQVSGPGTAVFGAASSLSTGVSGLVAGTYVFKLTATDDNSLTASATVTITVDAAVTPPVNVPPTVSAGSPQTITLPISSVTLTGTATGNGGATISSTDWTQVSGPGTAVFGSASGLSTGVSGLVAGTYVFKLTATDDNSLTASATVTITVDAAVTPPPVHVPPVANAGPDQTISLPFTDLTLDGSGSYDTDGTIVSYNWVELSGDGGVTIANSSQAQPTLYGLIAGTYVFQLTVTDNTGATGVATVTITVSAAVTPPPPTSGAPVASAGKDTTIALPANTVELDGSGSTDPSGETLSYQWTEQSGPGTAAIAFPGSAATSVGGLQPGLYIFKLTVTNSSGLSATATVQIRVVNDERQSDSGSAQVQIYPNPVETTLNVKFTDVNTNGQVLLRIFDMKGTLVMGQQVEVSGGQQIVTFNVSRLAVGTYALQVIVGTKQTYQLIVKQ